jgi:hypothetical protein
MKLEFSGQMFENTLILNMKIHRVGAKLFHVGGWTDRWTDRHDEINSLFLQFCEHA